MRDSARYAKIVFEDLCQVVEQAIDLYRQDGKPLPPASSFWLMPRASISSCKNSPGEIAMSDTTREPSVAIRVAHFLNDYALLVFAFRHEQAPPAGQSIRPRHECPGSRWCARAPVLWGESRKEPVGEWL